MGRLNKIMLIGNAGQDAEMRYTPNGDSVASFTMAVNNNFTNREGQQIDETEWFRINVWGRRAEFVSNYIKKGMQVYAEGRLKSNLYQDNAGETKVSLDVNAFDVQIVQDPQQQNNPVQPQQNNPVQPPDTGHSMDPPPNPAQPQSKSESDNNDDESLPW